MQELPAGNIALVIVALWTIPWKLYAVWLAARNNHKKWFIALVIINTMAILEIIYIFKVVKKSWADVKGDFRKAWTSIRE